MKRTITIEIDNDDLDALEDYLVSKLSDERSEQLRNRLLDLWAKLCKKFDVPNKSLNLLFQKYGYQSGDGHGNRMIFFKKINAYSDDMREIYFTWYNRGGVVKPYWSIDMMDYIDTYQYNPI